MLLGDMETKREMHFTVSGYTYSVDRGALLAGFLGGSIVAFILYFVHGEGWQVNKVILSGLAFVFFFSLVETIVFVENTIVWMSGNALIVEQNKQARKRLIEPVEEYEEESNDDGQSEVETGIPINGGRDGYIITHRTLTDKERAWGEFLTTLALHAAARKSFKSNALVGEVLTETKDWTNATSLLRDMGLVYKANGDKLGTRPIRSFEQVVNLIPMRLSSVTLVGSPPPIPPAPPETLELLDKSRVKLKGQ